MTSQPEIIQPEMIQPEMIQPGMIQAKNLPPQLDVLITDLRAATEDEAADEAIISILNRFVAAPDAADSILPDFAEDDVVLFEDDTLSVWFCRFQPGATVPPHDHRIAATIAVVTGTEQNDFFTADDEGRLIHSDSRAVTPGQVLHIPDDAIHSVSCVSDIPSTAIHVYQGALTRIDRNLFDTDRNETLAYTDENYARLTKQS